MISNCPATSSQRSLLINCACSSFSKRLAFSFATEEGWRGTAIRYLKRYIALLAMGPLIMVVFTAGNHLQMGVTSSLGTGAGFFLQILVNPIIGFAEVGIIKKLQSVVSEAFGA